MITVESLYNGHLCGQCFERWPFLRGCKLFIWDLGAWPLYSNWELVVNRGSTVFLFCAGFHTHTSPSYVQPLPLNHIHCTSLCLVLRL